MRKPRLFIASSVESLPIAEAINVNLDHPFEVTIWKNGTFRLSSTSIDDLVEKSSTVDFAVFVFSPDDIASIKEKKTHVVRDNVIFEMGLFVGAIGKSRCFILKPRTAEMHLPTDLLGVNAADYDENRTDGDIVSATNRACSLFKTEIDRIGLINHIAISEVRILAANPTIYDLRENDFQVLAACLRSHTSSPMGSSISNLSNTLRGLHDTKIMISIIKLERMGLIDKCVETDEQDGYNYYAYSITESGIDALLEYEASVYASAQNQPDDFEDEMPF